MVVFRWFGWVVWGVVVLLGSAAFALTLEVQLRDTVLLAGETLTLGDVAEISYPDPEWENALRKLSLGVPPLPGEERVITPQDIYTRVVARRIPNLDYIYFSGAPFVRVQAAGVLLEGSSVAARLREALRDRFPQAERIEVTLEDDRIPFPSSDFQVVLPGTLKPWGVQRAVLVDAQGTKKREVRFTVSVYQPVVRAARDLRPGETIREGDVTLQVEPLSLETERALGSLEAVLGKPVRRTVRAGDVLTPALLGKDVLIKRGDLVTLVAQYKGVVVTAPGKARGEGTLGDRIVVENLSSRKRMEGIIVDERTVQVVVQ